MLLNGVNHVAIVTKDTDRLVAFYRAVFEADVAGRQGFEGFWLTFIRIGETAELNVFEIEGNTEADRQTRDRLIARGASDQFVTDFGPVLSIFFRDPDGLEGEVCVPNPDAVPGVHNPPGTPAARYAPQS
jgi:catechol 2,3-dioxygenase-like lactoylglutathione lyase family enzyme